MSEIGAATTAHEIFKVTDNEKRDQARGDIISRVSSRSKIIKFRGVISPAFLPRKIIFLKFFFDSLTILYTNAYAYMRLPKINHCIFS